MITITPADLDDLYAGFCANHCSSRHHPDHMHHSQCLNCSALEFTDWLEQRNGDHK